MKILEVIYSDKIKELKKQGKPTNEYEFYLLDWDLVEKQNDIAVAFIKVNVKKGDTQNTTEKVLDIIEKLYKGLDYIVRFDKL